MPVLTRSDQVAITQHYRDAIGPIGGTMPFPLVGGAAIDLVFMPAETSDSVHVIATRGLSAHLMSVPSDVAEPHPRIELLLGTPGTWDLGSDALRSGRAPVWPFSLLGFVASTPWITRRHVDIGHTMMLEGGRGSLPGCPFEGAMLVPATILRPDIIKVPSGWDVTFMGVVALLQEELDFKARHGATALYRKLREGGVNLTLNPDRSSVVS